VTTIPRLLVPQPFSDLAHAEELAQLRADAARERGKLCAALESRAQVIEESDEELRPGRVRRASP
jgi:hypothetical protein